MAAVNEKKEGKNHFKLKYAIKRWFYFFASIFIVTFIFRNFTPLYLYSPNNTAHFLEFIVFVVFWTIIQHSFGIGFFWSRLYLLPFSLGILSTHILVNFFYFNFDFKNVCSSQYFLFNGISIVINIGAMIIVRLFSQKREKSKNKSNSPTYETDENPSEIIEWIMKDDPIDDPDSPFCVVKNASDRISEILNNTPTSIGLVGSYGSGKSSVIEILSNNEDIKNNFILCRIDAWGRESDKLDKQIISKMIDAMKSEVDVSSLLFIPQQYSASLSDSHWILHLILALNSGRYDTEKLIGKIDHILEMFGKKLILIVEDLDRNHLNHKISPKVLSLFDRLNKCRNISVIITINASSIESAVLNRVCDNIIGLPYLQGDIGRKRLKEFRDVCLSYYKDDIPAFISKDENNRIQNILERGYHDVADLINLFNDQVDDAVTIMVHLSKSIRNIKLFFRETWTNWEYLHGEVNFDDLLIINSIKLFLPEIYNYMIDNYYKFSHRIDPKDQGRSHKLETRRTEFEKRLHKDLDIPINHINNLIDLIFPEWNDRNDSSTQDSQRVTIANFGEKYWKRIVECRIDTSEIRDQMVLRDITRCQKGTLPIVSFAQKLYNSQQYSDHFEKFGNRLTRIQINKITMTLLELVGRKHKAKACLDIANGWVNLWRLSLKIDIGSDYQDWVLKCFTKTCRYSLALSNDVFYYWHNERQSDPQIRKRSPELLDKYYELLKRLWTKNHRALLQSLDTIIYYSLYHLVVLFPNEHRFYEYRNKSGKNTSYEVINMCAPTEIYTDMFSPNEFLWLRPILIKCINTDSHKIIPDILNVVARKEKYDETSGKRNKLDYYQFNHDVAEKWLGAENWKDIMQMTLSLKHSTYNDPDNIIQALIKDAKRAAKEYLKDKKPPRKPRSSAKDKKGL